MAILSEKFRLLYICTAKTGSTSLSNVMLEKLEGEWLPEGHIWKQDKIAVDYKHSTLAQLVEYGLMTPEKLSRTNIFLTVRNPYSWVLSNYLFQCKCYNRYLEEAEKTPDWILARIERIQEVSSQTFEEYVVAAFQNKQASVYNHYIRGFEEKSKIEFIKIENAQSEFSGYLQDLSIPIDVNIPHANSTLNKQVDYKDYYSSHSKAIVESAFEKDFANMGYHF